MAAKGSPISGKGTSGPERRVDPTWSRRAISAAVDLVMGSSGDATSTSVAHEVLAHHAYDGNDEDKCATCGEKETRGESLARTLAAMAAEAPAGSKWAGLQFRQHDNGDWGLDFDAERADAWAKGRIRFLLYEEPVQTTRDNVWSMDMRGHVWPEERVDLLRTRAERAQKDGDLEAASEMLYSAIPDMEGWRMM